MLKNRTSQKTALVTGGAVRVGRAITETLLEAGYAVGVHYQGSAAEARGLAKQSRSVTLLRADLSNLRNIPQFANAVEKKLGKLDLIVNSAAIFCPTPLGKTSEAQWNALHDLNLKAPYFLIQELRPLLRKGASIVNIADTSGWAPAATYVPYGITKAGIIAMTLGLARELAPDIRVNAVAPGPVLLPEDYDAKQRKKSIERTLLKREGTPRSVAEAVRFLAENDFVTGAVLPVDGGRALAAP